MLSSNPFRNNTIAQERTRQPESLHHASHIPDEYCDDLGKIDFTDASGRTLVTARMIRNQSGQWIMQLQNHQTDPLRLISDDDLTELSIDETLEPHSGNNHQL